ncbi:diguanylate cyclase [Devosia sp. UYZn731]|uniref:tetratricopeptide repeat-containing diguanylate cyclase n=1 Tax=Devosia sp. UYZn731 TaxID=3156345 RepID=UPI0033935B3A
MPIASAPHHDGLVLARHLLAKGQCVEALAATKQVFAQAENRRDKALMSRALVQLAWCCMRLGDPETGLDCLIGSRRLDQRGDDGDEQARTHAIEAFLLLDLGLSDEAFAAAELAVTSAEAAGEDTATAFAYNVKGVILALCRQPELGAKLLERAVALTQGANEETDRAFHLLNLGFCQIQLVDDAEMSERASEGRHWLDLAIETNDAAIAAARLCGDAWTLRTALANGAEYQARSGNLDQAMAYLDAWAALPGDPGAGLRIHYLYTLGDVQLRVGRLEDARNTCAEALAQAEMGNQVDHQLNAVQRLCDVHEALGQFETALGLHRRFHALYVRQSGETTRRRAKIAEIQLESEHLRARAQELSMQVMLDPLTGIANRRCFDQILSRLDGTPYAVGMLDLDHFKSVNDRFSHQVGDTVLRRVARIMVEQIGVHGHAVRLGGEEFALIFPGAVTANASVFCDTIRMAIADTDWSDIAADLRVTASIGLAAGTGGEADDLIAAADRRLYAAKTQGRDRLVAFDADAFVMAG